MKLATLKDGSRDGLLAVVSRDMTMAHHATGIATTLQQVLDDWNFRSPPLEDLYATLNGGKARHAFPFKPQHCMAPLPRAHQWVDGSAYLNHVELVRKARGAEVPKSFYEDPLMYQGGSDDFIGPNDDAVFASTDWGIDFESEVAVVTADVEMGTTPDAALESVRLLMLVNDWSLRNLIPGELAKGFGFEVDAPVGAGKDGVVARADEVIAAALVHQRVFVKAGRHLGAARLAHQFHMVEVCRAVGPLVGARQGRHELPRVKRKGVPRLAAVERGVEVFELRRDEVPVVQHLLQRAGDAAGVVRTGHVARDDDQEPVARAVLQGSEFHACGPRSRAAIRERAMALLWGDHRRTNPLRLD